MSKSKAVQKLNELGQVIWNDNLSREILEHGGLESAIDRGVSGVTTNPTIFKNAITGSCLYDTQILELKNKGLGTPEIIEALMVSDVGRAADLLLDTYKASGGQDGFVSIEVSPTLAYKTEETLVEARRLWASLNRLNIMIKVPATEEGIPAISQLISEGINVNVTLIFSVDVYCKVMQAYLSGLKRRLEGGHDVTRIASVASFFVSRVDSIIEKTLEEKKVSNDIVELLLGKLGVANSKLAYVAYKETFSGSEFEELSAKGAHTQKPLWASTGTKNPKFDPLLYVKELVGSPTVNTLPEKTLGELLQSDYQFSATIEENVNQAEASVAAVQKLGADLAQLLETLRVDGVRLFADSYGELIEALNKKLEVLN